ncbi:MAG: hypothetical protein ABEJ72_11350 [Candidatus Aenigmatarchaeota archaeon]
MEYEEEVLDPEAVYQEFRSIYTSTHGISTRDIAGMVEDMRDPGVSKTRLIWIITQGGNSDPKPNYNRDMIEEEADSSWKDLREKLNYFAKSDVFQRFAPRKPPSTNILNEPYEVVREYAEVEGEHIEVLGEDHLRFEVIPELHEEVRDLSKGWPQLYAEAFVGYERSGMYYQPGETAYIRTE